jgi:hypothetical protein
MVEGIVLFHDDDPQNHEDHHQQGECPERADVCDGIEDEGAVGEDEQVDGGDDRDEDAERFPFECGAVIEFAPEGLVDDGEEHCRKRNAHAAAGEEAQGVVGDVQVGDVVKRARRGQFEQIDVGVGSVDAEGEEEGDKHCDHAARGKFALSPLTMA